MHLKFCAEKENTAALREKNYFTTSAMWQMTVSGYFLLHKKGLITDEL